MTFLIKQGNTIDRSRPCTHVKKYLKK